MNRKAALGTGIVVSAIVLSVALFGGGSNRVYLPMVYNAERPIAKPSSPLKGCCGCTQAQMVEMGAAWSYVYGPHLWDGARPVYCMVKPLVHELTKAERCARRWGWLMWGNEMDLEGPHPQVAAAMYPDAEALGVKLAIGGASHLDTELEWLREFRKSYRAMWDRRPRIDALHAHCYFPPESAQNCVEHVQNVKALADSWGAEMWLSEFACVPMSDRRCLATSEAFIRWLEAEGIPWSWFGARLNPDAPWDAPFVDGSLYDWDTRETTAIGEWFKEVP